MSELEDARRDVETLRQMWVAEQERGNRFAANLNANLKKFKAVLLKYDDELEHREIEIEKDPSGLSLGHARWLCRQAQGVNDSLKMNRWVGWVQCILVQNAIYTLEDVKGHSRDKR